MKLVAKCEIIECLSSKLQVLVYGPSPLTVQKMRNGLREKVVGVSLHTHYENMLIQINWKFYHQKRKFFQIKNSDIFHISAQNIDCGYSLEPLDEAVLTSTHNLCFEPEIRKNNEYPCKPQFYYIKVEVEGFKII